MKKDPANVTRRKHKFGFHNRGVQWVRAGHDVGQQLLAIL